jgi:hypothetical protein
MRCWKKQRTSPDQVAEVIKAAKKTYIPGLPVWAGKGCPYCEYIALDNDTVTRHRRKIHQDKEEPRPPGRRSRGQASKQQSNRSIISCQRLFPNFSGSQLFEVDVPNPSSSPSPNPYVNAVPPNPCPMPPVAQVSASDPASRTAVAQFALAYVRQTLAVDPNESESERVSQSSPAGGNT